MNPREARRLARQANPDFFSFTEGGGYLMATVNDFTHTWVAVSEIARARGTRASGAVLLAAAGFIAVPPAPTFAAPPNPPVATQLPTGAVE